MNYLKMLVEDFHSTVVATIGIDGHPQTRVIDMMLWDDKGVYFLTAKGKSFYEQLMKQKYISLSATKDKKAISLRGQVQNIGSEKRDEIFIKNTYMQQLYPNDTRDVLEVFWLYEAQGEYFDISNPSCIVRESILIGTPKERLTGYVVREDCIRCKLCYAVCPQKCIDISKKPVVIDQAHCLHCGRCAEICPKQTIQKRELI